MLPLVGTPCLPQSGVPIYAVKSSAAANLVKVGAEGTDWASVCMHLHETVNAICNTIHAMLPLASALWRVRMAPKECIAA